MPFERRPEIKRKKGNAKPQRRTSHRRLQKRSVITQKVKLQVCNKTHGAQLLQRAYNALPARLRNQVRILKYTYVKPVQDRKELEERVRQFARMHLKAERIFIRGNPIEQVPVGKRENQWENAPRGHYYPKTNTFEWDNSIEHPKKRGVNFECKYETTEWLLAPTQRREHMHRTESLVFQIQEGHIRETTDLQKLPWGVRAFTTKVFELIELPKGIRANGVEFRYTFWEPTLDVPEFFDITLW